MMRNAWEDWPADRKRAAVKAVLNRAKVPPAAIRASGKRGRELMLQFVRDRAKSDWRFLQRTKREGAAEGTSLPPLSACSA
jgi:hypothetical protein